jgi:hypothetical protein
MAGLEPLLRPRSTEQVAARPGVVEHVHRTAVATLFGLHTIRFWIYLRLDAGRRLNVHCTLRPRRSRFWRGRGDQRSIGAVRSRA